MTSLYSCRSINAAEYRISKFDADFNLQSSYTMTQEGCDCPQGHKPTCRHRKMLPEFARQGHIGDGWFFDWDTRQWRKPINPSIEPAELPSPSSAVGDENPIANPGISSPPPAVEQKVQASAPAGVSLPKRRKA